MKQRFFLVLGATVASLSLLLMGAACEKHSWEDTKKHHQPHGGHDDHADHGDHDADHADHGDADKAEGDHGNGDSKGL